MFTATSAKTLTKLLRQNVKSLSAYLLSNVQNIWLHLFLKRK